LIRWYEDEHYELFNLDNDIGEAHDLASSHPELVEKLKTKLADRLRETGAVIPERR
jgi:hypothetical protein